MPLGQAPYGSREPPSPEEKPPPSSLRGFPGWSRYIFVLLAVGWVVALIATRGEKKPSAIGDTTECFADKACGDGWRCFAVPKDDRFAVSGVCSHVCEDG